MHLSTVRSAGPPGRRGRGAPPLVLIAALVGVFLAIACATTPLALGVGPTVPGAPTVGTVTGSTTIASVPFSAPADDGGSPILSYTATCTSSNGGLTRWATGASSPISVPYLTKGTSYTCAVTARNAQGDSAASAPSNTLPIAATVPSAPMIGTASPAGNLAVVGLLASADDGGSPILSYTVTCTSSNGGTTRSATGSPNHIYVLNLSKGKSYTCSIIARNAQGDSPASDPSNTISIATTVPGAPTVGTVTGSTTIASVPFSAPADDGGSPILSYTATCTSSNGGLTRWATGASSPISVPYLTKGTSYTCAVTARNAQGDSAASAPSNTLPIAATVPSAPMIGTAFTLGGTMASVSFLGPSDDGGSPILSYTATCTSTDGATSLSASGNSSAIYLFNVPTNTRYTCSVTAHNAVGISQPSDPSNSLAYGTTVPAAPTIGTATSSATTASVPFTAPADTGGSAILSYTATCTSSNGGTTRSATGASSPISVPNLTKGTNYRCSVVARNTPGDSPASLASNTLPIAATVPGAPTSGPATSSATTASVSFAAPGDTGGSAILSHTATCTSSDGGTTRSATGPGSPISVSGLTEGAHYQCSVVATNAVGASLPSGLSDEIFIPAPAPAPTPAASSPVAEAAPAPAAPDARATARPDPAVQLGKPAPTGSLAAAAGVRVPKGATVTLRLPAKARGVRVVNGRLVATQPGTYRVTLVIRTRSGKQSRVTITVTAR